MKWNNMFSLNGGKGFNFSCLRNELVWLFKRYCKIWYPKNLLLVEQQEIRSNFQSLKLLKSLTTSVVSVNTF